MKQTINNRCTFAIISHPDAGKTTITEKILLYGKVIQNAGTVKGRKSDRYVTSDWMELEKQRGISVTTSVMQFPYQNRIFNLLDTPGHADFSEDTYRTLTAVDSALMVIDAVKGVEPRTVKLMEVCRLRDTPIITFINKLDRDCREFIELLDEIESKLKINCAPITWPIGHGRDFKGLYHLGTKKLILYVGSLREELLIDSIDDAQLPGLIGEELLKELKNDLGLIHGASHSFDLQNFLDGTLTPVFFGSALNNFGVKSLLDAFATYAPAPQSRLAKTRIVHAYEKKFSGFVFKIQANMDPQHRDRIAFLRICSGTYRNGIKMKHIRINKVINISNALTFMASGREKVEQATAGDIIGLHNHGTIQIGDTFSEGEDLKFLGIPNFAPELFQAVRPSDPLKMKALQKGLVQLAEEGATQVFRPLISNRIILGAVGQLQFDVVAYRLKFEYKVECIYEQINIATVRWVVSMDRNKLRLFESNCSEQLALDSGGQLAYIASSMVNLQLVMERWPDIKFSEIREHSI